jgi:GT2 family glycosyltransferase
MISVCTSSYVTSAERLASLERLVESIPEECEIVLHDDGSPFPFTMKRTRILRSQENRGWTAGTAAAVLASTGDVVLLADDDVELPKDFFPTLHGLMRALGNVGALSWRSKGPNPGQSEREIRGLLEPATELAGYCMAFRRSVYDAIGGLDTQFRQYCGDSELALRMTLAGYPSYRVWWPLVLHEERGGTGGQDRRAIAERDLRAFAVKYGRTGREMEKIALGKLIPRAEEHTT